MWTGDKAHNQISLHKWFGWIYISEFNSFEKNKYLHPTTDDIPTLKFKIGYTDNIKQRKAALELSVKTNKNIQNSSTIIYSWSLPKAEQFETKIKQFLKAFIQKERLEENTSGRTEITHGLTLETLIHVIQLCVLDTCLCEGYLNCVDTDDDILKELLKSELRSPPDVIIDNRTKYNGQKLSKNVQTIFNVDKVWVRLKLQKKYPTSFTREPGMFVQWVFNSDPDGTDESGSGDDRIENPNLKDSDTITDDFVQEDPNKSGIKNPYFIGECVFTEYKKVFVPCRIIGYGLGLHLNTYAIEWLDFRLDNEIMTFPMDDEGRYKTWLDIAGNPARHEYKKPTEVVSWHSVRPNHERPDVRRWPSNAERKDRDDEHEEDDEDEDDEDEDDEDDEVNRTYVYTEPGQKPILNNRIRFLQGGYWWHGTIVEVNNMYKWYKVQTDSGESTKKRFNEFKTGKYGKSWEFLTKAEDEEAPASVKKE